jgi:hypothetical protein
MTRFILIVLKIIKSNNKWYNTLCLASAYFPDSGNKYPNIFQDFNDEITDHVKKLDNNSYVLLGSDDSNAAIGIRSSKIDKNNASTWKPMQ